jgi:hypothetical protein
MVCGIAEVTISVPLIGCDPLQPSPGTPPTPLQLVEPVTHVSVTGVFTGALVALASSVVDGPLRKVTCVDACAVCAPLPQVIV